MKKFKLIVLLLCLFVPFSFAACENKNKQTLSTPTILEIKGGTIVFEQVDDAEYYTLSINDHTVTINTRNNVNTEIIDDKINFDASNIFVVGDSYSVKIKANASGKNSSKYSQTVSYKHNGNIEKPTNLKVNGTVLTWDAVENASYYLVKIITPNDTILFDKEGNVLTQDDPESIAKADLTAYSFNTNQFDFSSLLAVAGNYKFYVSAVLSVGTNYIESGYSTSVSYTHFVNLKKPTTGAIKKVGTSLHLLTAIDENANAISIICNRQEKTSEINGSDLSISMVNNNLLDINLNLYFQSFIEAEKLNFENLTQFSFTVQSKYIANSPETAFYYDSEYSNYIYFENTEILSTPSISLQNDLVNDCYVANWSCANVDKVSEYKLLIAYNDGIKEFTLDSSIKSKLIYGDFLAVAVKAVGVGSYVSSQYSPFVSNPELTSLTPVVSSNFDEPTQTLTWNNISNAYYVVEFGNEIHTTNVNSFTINTSEIKNQDYSVKVTAFREDSKHSTNQKNLTYSSKLNTPTFGYSQGFNSTNLYELTFTGSENAIGYYVYLKTNSATEFERIDNLYTSTKIDLSKYICNEGNYTDYEVKVQAVADTYSLYENSELSSSVSVSHIKILEKPEFYKLNDTIIPVTKQISGNSTKYILKFYGIENAGSYEVLINYNKINVAAKNTFFTGIYEIDISNFLIAANNYEIKVRAIPTASAVNIEASEYAVANYALTKQLAMVQNINVSENDGVFTLSFDPIDNAVSYRIRIVKENDSNYVNYLNEVGLTNSFEVTQATDVSAYVKQQGVYYFYVTALAPKQNSYYADATESINYGYISKLTTLEKPKDIKHYNISKLSYLLSWTGDDNADYYLVKIIDPRNISYEFKVYNATSTDINKYLTIQGTYTISIYSMINPVSENAKEYASSSAAIETLRYVYQSQKDFERYSVYMYGTSYDFSIDNVNDLKNLLWYHYLYEIDPTTNMSLFINAHTKEDFSQETLTESILRLANEANDLLLHNFNNDEVWLNKIENIEPDNELFSYLCTKLIEIYPEFNTLESPLNLTHSAGSQIFTLYYRNALNQTKIDSATKTKSNTNYGNEYSYIDLYSRKSATGAFGIDAREEMIVTTTEQLIQAVQHNRKPRFVGESGTAELVYTNAKLVLSAIVTSNMSDTEKVTAIFNWLEANYDLTYYSIGNKSHLTGSVEKDNLLTYGLNKIYYLEGIFEDISIASNGDIVVGSNLATSQSYSKAFALLCAIEGIDATVINGTYTYYDTTTETDITVIHSWNKVHIDTSIDYSGKIWYSLDLTFSDNRIYYNDLNKGYGISSHTYFLTSDHFAELNLKVKDLTHIISNAYKSNRACTTSYNYYQNTSFKMTYDEIDSTILDFENNSTNISDFEYSKEFNPKEKYQLYAKTSGYGTLQAFLLNSMIYAKHNADNNSSNKSVFEFRFNWSDNGGSNIFDIVRLREIFDSVPNQYSLRIKLVNDANNSVYTVEDSENRTTTVVYIVEKIA